MDVDLEVSVLAVAGRGDIGGGLIWRAQDEQNYYLTRANPLEQNIRSYRVVKGVRQQLANFNQIIPTSRWHALRVVVRGNHFQVMFITIDPSFHAVPFYPGQVVYDGAGANVWRKLYIDTTKLTNGVHKLFLRTDAPISSGTGSGVFVVEFVVDNPVATP